MRKLKILFIWLCLGGYLVTVLSFVRGRYDKQVCGAININIIDSLTNRFVTSDDVMKIMLENGGNILGYPRHTINTYELEDLLSGVPFIRNATLYKTADGKLNADIIQRRPVLRVINQRGLSYYLDSEGVILPVTPNYTSRVLVANGYISEPFLAESLKSIFKSEVPETRRNSVIFDLYDLALFIDSSELWKAQITQIHVNNKYEYEMIPRVGAHVIKLGDAYNYVTKFRKLEAFYRYGLNSMGWNNYGEINLKYENQVVCTKR